MTDELIAGVAGAFVSCGCSVAKVAAYDTTALTVGMNGHNLMVIVAQHEATTPEQQRLADSWHGQLCWCFGRDDAHAIAHALRDGEF